MATLPLFDPTNGGTPQYGQPYLYAQKINGYWDIQQAAWTGNNYSGTTIITPTQAKQYTLENANEVQSQINAYARGGQVTPRIIDPMKAQMAQYTADAAKYDSYQLSPDTQKQTDYLNMVAAQSPGGANYISPEQGLADAQKQAIALGGKTPEQLAASNTANQLAGGIDPNAPASAYNVPTGQTVNGQPVATSGTISTVQAQVPGTNLTPYTGTSAGTTPIVQQTTALQTPPQPTTTPTTTSTTQTTAPVTPAPTGNLAAQTAPLTPINYTSGTAPTTTATPNFSTTSYTGPTAGTTTPAPSSYTPSAPPPSSLALSSPAPAAFTPGTYTPPPANTTPAPTMPNIQGQIAALGAPPAATASAPPVTGANYSQADTYQANLTRDMALSPEQTDLQNQGIALDQQLKSLNQGQGVMSANLEDQAIQLGFVTGQQSAVEKRYALQRADVMNQQQTLQQRLALAQQKMQSSIDVDKTQLAYATDKAKNAEQAVQTQFQQEMAAKQFNENTRQFGMQYALDQLKATQSAAGQAFDEWATQQGLSQQAAAQAFQQWATQQGLSADAQKQAFSEWQAKEQMTREAAVQTFDQWAKTQSINLDSSAQAFNQWATKQGLSQDVAKESYYQWLTTQQLSLDQQKAVSDAQVKLWTEQFQLAGFNADEAYRQATLKLEAQRIAKTGTSPAPAPVPPSPGGDPLGNLLGSTTYTPSGTGPTTSSTGTINWGSYAPTTALK